MVEFSIKERASRRNSKNTTEVHLENNCSITTDHSHFVADFYSAKTIRIVLRRLNSIHVLLLFPFSFFPFNAPFLAAPTTFLNLPCSFFAFLLLSDLASRGM